MEPVTAKKEYMVTTVRFQRASAGCDVKMIAMEEVTAWEVCAIATSGFTEMIVSIRPTLCV